MPKKKFSPLSCEELEALLPPFEVEKLLFKDKNSATYKATERSSARNVVIKLISDKIASEPAFRKYFSKQLPGIKELEHEHIVKVRKFGFLGDYAMIVSDFIKGNPLHKSTKGQQVDAEQAVQIIAKVAEGLAHAHNQGVFHTDVKTSKIFLDPQVKPLIANFGSFLRIHSASGKPDYGSSGYAARETLAGVFDVRSEVYSLAVVFYELLTAELPKLPYQHPSDIASCGTRFDNFLAKALNDDPANRHQTMEEFSAELQQALVQPEVIKTSGVQLLASGQPLQSTEKSLEASPNVVYENSSFTGFIVASIAVILIGVGAVLFALKGNGSKAERDETAVQEDTELVPTPPIPENNTQEKKGTVLVNFSAGNQVSATAADYQKNDEAVQLTAPVNDIFTNAGTTQVQGVGMVIETFSDRAFTAIRGPSAGQPILDSYVAARNVEFLTVEVSSLEELAPGTEFTVVVYAVGDKAGQDGKVSIFYNNEATPTIFTESGRSEGTAAHASFTLTKVDGVDNFTIRNAGAGLSVWRCVNGFSITGSTVSTP